MNGLVFDIQRFSLHDGPGIRTTVFLQGCPLNCFWCHNPEGRSFTKQLQFAEQYCIGCMECFRVCPTGAHQEINGRHVIDRSLCQLCGACVENCCSHALTFSSREMSSIEVFEAVAADEPFFAASGGGVTLSGGDPVAQADFAVEILSQCKAQGIHTTVDTALCCEWERIEKMLPVCDLWLVDLKSMDAQAHERATGVSNELILANLRHLSAQGTPIIIRTPVIPGLTDGVDAIAAIAKEIRSLANIQAWELLPFHRLGEGKFQALGIECPTQGLPLIPKETLVRLTDTAREAGIPVKGATA